MFRGQKSTLQGGDVVDIGRPVWVICVSRRDAIVKATGASYARLVDRHTQNQEGLFVVNVATSLSAAQADPCTYPSCAARRHAPTGLASAGNLSACCQLDWQQVGGTVTALVAEARCTGRQDCRTITHSGRNRRWGGRCCCWPCTSVTFLAHLL